MTKNETGSIKNERWRRNKDQWSKNNAEVLMMNEQGRKNDKHGSMIIEDWTMKYEQGSLINEQ